MYEIWKKVSIADIVIYAVLIGFSIYPAWRSFKQKSYFKYFFIRIAILLPIKLASGATTVAFIVDINKPSQEYNLGLLIASLVMSPIATGFMIFLFIFSTKYVSRVARNGAKANRVKFIYSIRNVIQYPREVESWEDLTTKLALIAMILTAVGGGMSGSGDLKTTKALTEAGTILYLVAFVAASGCTIAKLQQLEKFGLQPPIKWILINLLFIIPLMIVRIVYGILSAANLNTNSGNYVESFSRYSYLLGDWKLYTFLGFLEDVLIIILLIVISYLALQVEEYPISSRTDEAKLEAAEEYSNDY